MGKFKDLTGERFGNLVVVGQAGRYKGTKVLWNCKCDCGNTTTQLSHTLTKKLVVSCGCYNRLKTEKGNTKHGLRYTRLYSIWKGIKTRCNNLNNHAYKNYGARGIKVCEEWSTFLPFYEWAMANGYEEHLTIDRIDVDGDYEPQNCRWATMQEQLNNTRVNRFITIGSETKTMAEWAREFGLSYNGMKYKLSLGLSDDELLSLRTAPYQKGE